MTTKEAIERLSKYCAYQERCHIEVRTKLVKLKVYGNQLEEVIAHLIEHGFLNEERFARSFARGKFRIKKWGKRKIIRELKKRQISRYCIDSALSEIDEKEYKEVLHHVLTKYVDRLNEMDRFEKWKKTTSFALNKGYEPELVKKELDQLI